METVVTLLGQQSIVFKFFKPVAEVQLQETLDALKEALSGNTGPQHLSANSQPTATVPLDMPLAMECDEED